MADEPGERGLPPAEPVPSHLVSSLFAPTQAQTEPVHVYEGEAGWEVHHADEHFTVVDAEMGRDFGRLTMVEAVVLYEVIGEALRGARVVCDNCGTSMLAGRMHVPNGMGSCVIAADDFGRGDEA